MQKTRTKKITTENSRIGAKDVRGPDVMERTQGNVLHSGLPWFSSLSSQACFDRGHGAYTYAYRHNLLPNHAKSVAEKIFSPSEKTSAGTAHAYQILREGNPFNEPFAQIQRRIISIECAQNV